MTNMFGNFSTEGLEETTDFLGGGGLVDTGVYHGTVKLAYAGKSGAAGSEAQSVTILVDAGGREIKETFWISGRDGNNSYADKKDPSKRHPLPGFAMVDELCLVTTGLPLSSQNVEEKTVKIYDFDARKELPQNVPVLVDLLGKEVTVAVVQQIVDKRTEVNGKYVNSGETRNENTFEKFIHKDTGCTVNEIKGGLTEGAYLPAWEAKNAGKPPRNRSKGSEGKSGAPGAAGAATQKKPAKSLFG